MSGESGYYGSNMQEDDDSDSDNDNLQISISDPDEAARQRRSKMTPTLLRISSIDAQKIE